MSVKPDWWIKQQAEQGMIKPFESTLISRRHDHNSCISYGLASAAYDARLGREFVIYANRINPLDPMRVTDKDYFTRTCSEYIIRPGEFVLATTVETFVIPRDIVATVVEKSTYKRCGISVGNTRLEPEWFGQVTLEIRNDNNARSVILRAGEGIVAIEFHELSATEEEIDAQGHTLHIIRGCDISYADRKGKYQNQVGVTMPKGVEDE